MAQPRTLSHLSATAERGGTHGDTRTGRVAVHAMPDWLKDDRCVTASLSPAEARQLALGLLAAAERAEGRTVNV